MAHICCRGFGLVSAAFFLFLFPVISFVPVSKQIGSYVTQSAIRAPLSQSINTAHASNTKQQKLPPFSFVLRMDPYNYDEGEPDDNDGEEDGEEMTDVPDDTMDDDLDLDPDDIGIQKENPIDYYGLETDDISFNDRFMQEETEKRKQGICQSVNSDCEVFPHFLDRYLYIAMDKQRSGGREGDRAFNQEMMHLRREHQIQHLTWGRVSMRSRNEKKTSMVEWDRALMSEDMTRTIGNVVCICANSPEDAKRLVAADPYQKCGLLGQSKLFLWRRYSTLTHNWDELPYPHICLVTVDNEVKDKDGMTDAEKLTLALRQSIRDGASEATATPSLGTPDASIAGRNLVMETLEEKTWYTAEDPDELPHAHPSAVGETGDGVAGVTVGWKPRCGPVVDHIKRLMSPILKRTVVTAGPLIDIDTALGVADASPRHVPISESVLPPPNPTYLQPGPMRQDPSKEAPEPVPVDLVGDMVRGAIDDGCFFEPAGVAAASAQIWRSNEALKYEVPVTTTNHTMESLWQMRVDYANGTVAEEDYLQSFIDYFTVYPNPDVKEEMARARERLDAIAKEEVRLAEEANANKTLPSVYTAFPPPSSATLTETNSDQDADFYPGLAEEAALEELDLQEAMDQQVDIQALLRAGEFKKVEELMRTQDYGMVGELIEGVTQPRLTRHYRQFVVDVLDWGRSLRCGWDRQRHDLADLMAEADRIGQEDYEQVCKEREKNSYEDSLNLRYRTSAIETARAIEGGEEVAPQAGGWTGMEFGHHPISPRLYRDRMQSRFMDMSNYGKALRDACYAFNFGGVVVGPDDDFKKDSPEIIAEKELAESGDLVTRRDRIARMRESPEVVCGMFYLLNADNADTVAKVLKNDPLFTNPKVLCWNLNDATPRPTSIPSPDGLDEELLEVGTDLEGWGGTYPKEYFTADADNFVKMAKAEEGYEYEANLNEDFDETVVTRGGRMMAEHPVIPSPFEVVDPTGEVVTTDMVQPHTGHLRLLGPNVKEVRPQPQPQSAGSARGNKGEEGLELGLDLSDLGFFDIDFDYGEGDKVQVQDPNYKLNKNNKNKSNNKENMKNKIEDEDEDDNDSDSAGTIGSTVLDIHRYCDLDVSGKYVLNPEWTPTDMSKIDPTTMDAATMDAFMEKHYVPERDLMRQIMRSLKMDRLFDYPPGQHPDYLDREYKQFKMYEERLRLLEIREQQQSDGRTHDDGMRLDAWDMSDYVNKMYFLQGEEEEKYRMKLAEFGRIRGSIKRYNLYPNGNLDMKDADFDRVLNPKKAEKKDDDKKKEKEKVEREEGSKGGKGKAKAKAMKTTTEKAG